MNIAGRRHPCAGLARVASQGLRRDLRSSSMTLFSNKGAGKSEWPLSQNLFPAWLHGVTSCQGTATRRHR